MNSTITSALPRKAAPGAPAGAAPTPASDGPQDVVSLQGSSSAMIARCQRIGSVDPRESIQVSVILKPAKDLKVPDSPFQSASREQVADFAATPRQVGVVRDFATKTGLKVADVNPDTHTVHLQGTAADFSQAFGVRFGRYRDAAGQEFRGYQGSIHLPKDMAGAVDAVLGLDNRPVASPRMVVSHDAKPHFIAPRIADLYNFPAGTDGSGQTIGIIELGGGYQKGDLDEYFYRCGIKEPDVKAVSVDGAQNAPEGHASGPDGEVDLDVELAGGVAPGARVVVYFAPNTEQGFVDAINQAVHDKENHPNVLSISWGAPEKEWTAQGMTAMNNAFKEGAALGVNTYAAAGDNGSQDGEKDGKNHADFPAAAPYAIGCGGTRIDSADGKITSEKTWRDLWGWGGSTGGGVSDVFPEPDWQKAGANVPAPVNPAGGRGVPDVAGNASPFNGYMVVADGKELSIGGTSAVSPLYAGLTARLAQGVGGHLGFLTPTFYQHPKAFNDITEGSNGGFNAGPGWDATTGLGSPDGTRLLAMLQALKPPPASPPPAK